MKLLFDQNLSGRLIQLLNKEFPESIHVKDLGMEQSSDTDIWEYAKENGYIIISKDSDFHQRSFVHGHPPKVIWIKKGNCSTSEIASILKKQCTGVRKFSENPKSSYLVLE